MGWLHDGVCQLMGAVLLQSAVYRVCRLTSQEGVTGALQPGDHEDLLPDK